MPSLRLPRFTPRLEMQTAGYLMAGLGAVMFSAKAVIAKITYTYGVDAVTLMAFRMLFSLPFFLVIGWHQALEARKGRLPRLTLRQSINVIILGLLGYYLSSFLDFLGLQYITAGLERLILFLSPTMVLLITAFWLKRRIEPRQWVALALSYAGVILVFAHDAATGGSNVLLGSTFVFLSALSYAIYLIGSGELLKLVGATRFVAYVMTVSSVAALIQFFIVHPPAMLMQPTGVYGWSIVNAVVNTVIPVFLIMWAVDRVGAPMVSMLGLMGPVSVLFLAAWMLDEPITLLQLIGTALVLTGIFVLTVRKTSSSQGKQT